MIKNPNKDVFDIQRQIETSLIDLMKHKLEDPKNHAWGMLPSLIKKVINSIDNHDSKCII